MIPQSLVFTLKDFKCTTLTGDGFILTSKDNVKWSMVEEAHAKIGTSPVTVESDVMESFFDYDGFAKALRLACLLDYGLQQDCLRGDLYRLMDRARIRLHLTGEGLLLVHTTGPTAMNVVILTPDRAPKRKKATG